MLSVKALRERRRKLADEANVAADAAIARARAAGGGLAPEEERAQAAYNGQLAELDRLISGEGTSVPDAGPRHITPGATLGGGHIAPPADDGGEDDAAAASALPPLPARTRAAIARLYSDVGASAREETTERFRDTVAAVLGGSPMNATVMLATATEGIGSDGGYAVPPDVARHLFTRAVEQSVWASIGARVETMTSEERTILALDDDDETADAEATLKADWTQEKGEAAAQLMKLRQVKLRANKLMVLAATSGELAEDATPDYIPQLDAAIGRAIGKKFDRAVLTGTGAGQPLGLLNAPATISVTKEASQPATTFQWANAVKMWSRLAPGSHERAWWLMHPSVLPQALTMTLVVKNVAGTENVGGAQPPGVFQAGGPTGWLMLGRPVLITSRVKPLGTAGDVILVDPSQVVIGIRRGITIDRSVHVYFSSDRLAIRGKFRGDAQPVWETARTLVEGPDTVSPYVIVQTRS